MITIKSKAYARKDIQFLILCFNKGLTHCWVHNDNKFNTEPCWECQYRLACYDMHSALNHLLSLDYRMETEFIKSSDS